MRTQINGKDADWTQEIQDKWDAVKKGTTILSCNYFTPHPYANEYDQARGEEGFVYTDNRHKVLYCIIERHTVLNYPVLDKQGRRSTVKFLKDQKLDDFGLTWKLP